LRPSLTSRKLHRIAFFMNSLILIRPYKYEGTWVFDDPAVGLTREPFIAGIDTIIDHAVADIPNAMRGFDAIFSAMPFPGYTLKLEWQRSEAGGNWYYCVKSFPWRAGFAQRSSNISRNHRVRFTSRPKR
jgi:hypothetical protein